MEEKIYPMCPKGCQQDGLSCGRGRDYFQAQENPKEPQSGSSSNSIHPHHDYTSSHSFHHGKGRGGHHLENTFPTDSLAALLMQSGHHLFHLVRQGDVDADEIVKALSPDE